MANKTLPDGRIILDELCECGKHRSEHGAHPVHTRYRIAELEGHGSAPGCPQFTWKGFVFAPTWGESL